MSGTVGVGHYQEWDSRSRTLIKLDSRSGTLIVEGL